MGNYVFKTCEHCGKKMKRFRITKNGEFVCYNCYTRTVTIIGIGK